jgi:hypothetical protein
MQTNQIKIFIIILNFLLICVTLTGCINKENDLEMEDIIPQNIKLDQPLILPDWKDGEYHDYTDTTNFLNNLERKYPILVEINSIGKSVGKRDIWCIKITNEKNISSKNFCVIDGCIHGSEWESGELCLYLAEYLVINYGLNDSVSSILNTSVVYIIPILNPDGREEDDRYNGNGIDLNRNFDVHFGRFRGGSIPLGNPLGLKISYKYFQFLNKIFPKIFPSYVTNCGRRPFSEPESLAYKNFLDDQDKEKFSFYMNIHTAMHFVAPVYNILYKPEFTVSEYEKEVLNTAVEWCKLHTEYDIVKSDNYKFYGAGYVNHWVFKEYHVPSFLFEMYSQEFEPGISGGGIHEDLVYWMKESLPVTLFLLTNNEQLKNWDLPIYDPFLPENIPPSHI